MATIDNKKLIVTGASGFVGRQLIPRLVDAGCELLLVGREPHKLTLLFPNIENCSYDDIVTKGHDFHAVLHLAVLNNNASSDADEFQKVNVDLLRATLKSAKAVGIPRFLNATTFHALDGVGSEYARSKRAALDILDIEEEIQVTNIFLPAVYGDQFAGRLSIVNKFPIFIQPAVLMVLTALLPTVHVREMAQFLIHGMDEAPSQVFLANPQDKNPVYRLGKRFIDLAFSAAVFVFAGWLLAIVWLLVKTGSQGPGIFSQVRVGKYGKPFVCYKFRTMKTGTRQAGTHELTVDAITGVGAFLRKTKVDELPQIWNLVRGELSLVGPRPGLPVQTELFEARKKRDVFNVLPGITGLAQIQGIDMSDPQRLAAEDARYIAQRGLLLDVKIIIATFLGRGQGDKVKA